MTAVSEVAVAVPCAAVLGESATWSRREQALYWVDIRAPALHRLDPGSGHHQAWPMPDLCCGVVPCAGGGIIVALLRSLALFDPATAALTPLVDIEPASAGNRLNEAKCDRAGRLWVGSMRDFGADVTGALYAVGPDLAPRTVLRDIRIPNSLGWSPDDATMYFADTGDRTLRRYPFDLATGSLGEPSVLVGPDDVPGRPDGCTVDAEGHVWSTRFGAGLVARIAPDGRAVATIALPASQPTSCALGGPDLSTLYITTARQKLDPDALAREPMAGHLFAVRVATPGLPDAEFRIS